MAGVANEVLENKAIMNAFDTKNVIAQEAAAKSLGLSRDQLADMVMEQQKINTLQNAFGDQVTDLNSAQKEYNKLRADGMSAEDAAAKIGDESLAQQMESVSQAEKFEAAMMKVQEIFVALAEPLLAIITPIVDILLPVLQGIVGFIGYMIEGFKAMKIPLLALVGIIAVMNANLIVGAIASLAQAMFKTFGNIPFIGAILALAGIAAGVGYINSITKPKKTGDMFSPADGKTQVSTKEGGLFELSPNDDLVAAPGAADRMQNNGGGGQIDISPLIAEVKTLIGVNRQILAKTPVIEMGGNEVGQGINTAEREIQ